MISVAKAMCVHCVDSGLWHREQLRKFLMWAGPSQKEGYSGILRKAYRKSFTEINSNDEKRIRSEGVLYGESQPTNAHGKFRVP